MKILLVADVHSKPFGSKRTINGLKKLFADTKCDLIVFLGDTVGGPSIKKNYEKYLDKILSLTNGMPFATVFGNHDDEKCKDTKKDILKMMSKYDNCLTKGKDYYLDYGNTRLIFIDSGSYCDTDESFYAYVSKEQINWAKDISSSHRCILFQHIIMPDIMDKIEFSNKKKSGFVRDNKRYLKFKDDVKYTGTLSECPCPPDFNNKELDELKDNIACAVFGHDHLNDFELDVKGVRFIQCGGASYNSYDKMRKSTVKLLDTDTLKTTTIYI